MSKVQANRHLFCEALKSGKYPLSNSHGYKGAGFYCAIGVALEIFDLEAVTAESLEEVKNILGIESLQIYEIQKINDSSIDEVRVQKVVEYVESLP